MHKLIRIPLSGFAFASFYAGAAVLAWILLPLLRWRTRELGAAQQQLAIDDYMMRVYRLTLRFWAALGLMHYSVSGLERDKLPPPPWVIVANHPTLIDVLFVKAALPGVVVLVKAAVFRDPSVRRVLEACGDFKAPERDEQQLGGGTAVLDIFVDRLRAGRSVLVFPEGTRSPEWALRRFRRGAAEAAVRAGVPIIPVFVLADPPTLKKGDKWYDMPKQVPRFDVRVLDPIHTAGRDPRELTAEIRELLATRLEAAHAASSDPQRSGAD